MYIALDIGGTNIRIGKADGIDSPSFSDIKKVSVQNEYQKDIDTIVEEITSLSDNEHIDGIGISLAGIIAPSRQSVHISANLPTWNDMPLVHDLAERLHTQVSLANDAAAASLGEALFGEGKGSDFLYIIWGTGLGGTEIKRKDEELLIFPFEPGHQIVVWNDEITCGCGQRGCFEIYTAGQSENKVYHKKLAELSEDEWNILLEKLAHAIINILAIRPSQKIVFGGGVALHQADRITRVKDIVASHLTIQQAPEVQVSSLGDNAGLYGALALLHGDYHIL